MENLERGDHLGDLGIYGDIIKINITRVGS
jgi:hypothetical protein